MRNRGVALSLVIALVSTLLLPFSISANGSLSAPFVGYNIYPIGYDFEEYFTGYTFDLDLTGLRFNCQSYNSSGACSLYLQPSAYDSSIDGRIYASSSQTATNTNTIYQVDLILDNDYIGYVNITQSNISKNYYVNGNKISFTIQNPDNFNTLTVNNYSLQLHDSDLEFLMWQYPIESYNFITYFLGLNRVPVESFTDSYYTYPVFDLNSNDQIWRSTVTSGSSHILVFFIDKYVTSSNFNTYFSIPSDFSVKYENIRLVPLNNTLYGRIVKYTFTNNSDSSQSLQVNYVGSNGHIMPIYSGGINDEFLGTDFALQFGLSNSLLNNIQIIANGTQQSNDSISNLDDSTDELNESINDYVGVENQFNTNMNEALNDLDLNTNLPTAMGTKFLQSANWVRVQFNRMTENNPFGSVLGFSLVVGIALLVLGKIWK